MLFSDIEGSTRLLRSLGDLYGAVLSDQRSIIRAALGDAWRSRDGHRGRQLLRRLPVGAVRCQRCSRGTTWARCHVWPLSVALRVRMGLETGEPLRHEDSYMGIDVHRAARIAGSANGGQVVLGDSAKREVAGLLPSDVTLRDLGLASAQGPSRPRAPLPAGGRGPRRCHDSGDEPWCAEQPPTAARATRGPRLGDRGDTVAARLSGASRDGHWPRWSG